MKSLKFKPHLVKQILDGSKRSTWRLFDDKDLSVGDELIFINSDTGEKFGKKAKGWGSLPVLVKIGKTGWETSIFPDKKSGTYLLPLKAQVRKKEGILDDDTVQFILKLR